MKTTFSIVSRLVLGVLLVCDGGEALLAVPRGATSGEEQVERLPCQAAQMSEVQLQRGAKELQGPPAEAAEPLEVLVKVKKGSRAANRLAKAKRLAKADQGEQAVENELTVLPGKPGIKEDQPIFPRAKQEDPPDKPKTAAGAGKPPKAPKEQRDALFRWCRLELSAGADLQNVIADFKANPAVECAEPVLQYREEVPELLADAQWAEVGPPITASDTTTSATVTKRAFYRVVVICPLTGHQATQSPPLSAAPCAPPSPSQKHQLQQFHGTPTSTKA